MKAKIGGMAIVAVALIAVFMLIDAGGNWDYVLPRRAKKILAIILTGCIIAFSTMVFQTITNNRILTPSIIGLDSLYMFIQTFVIFVFGSTHMTIMNKNVNFLISTGLMVLFAGVLYKFLFKREGQNIYFLLLIGLIFGTLFGSLSTFMQVLIDPNEFQIVQDKMFASFNNVNTDLLILSFVLVIAIGIYFWRYTKYLDVLSLGRDQAINLGLPYDFVVKRFLIVIAILVSIATALVGPITFLGLLVANLAHQFMKTYQHKYLLAGSALISVVALVGGLLVVERVFTFSTTLSVIVNFIGGVYFIYLLLKENKA
ncbi:iron chelate uptake ABC transporter family permease subunit [Brevibacillus agri]|uniref:iron chelate uptake ABC transporter family permease subunit n=1 Tax=Brevibacillus agri TaxID=51101 RepID=UPI0002A4D0CF|nr:iron chelate uptake ABC transporter family permease subunit [Brevibacillus agri]ELK42248.1 ABC transporter permease [Brevibacillus agri BAB-2500]MED1642572.1 iron chelate uptake ABC transporter family permease subunit [Brevibacillus agri]MED1653130.1 iron chelate uptake ABC transporter family permease subunit [Brevibacillus agri]MED1686815.1 iron chelate uptake ABC transporter family permease subunit [Brevibacillus agri]MED1692194.1 iron chelate uptake ABC transporter family permease subuni